MKHVIAMIMALGLAGCGGDTVDIASTVGPLHVYLYCGEKDAALNHQQYEIEARHLGVTPVQATIPTDGYNYWKFSFRKADGNEIGFYEVIDKMKSSITFDPIGRMTEGQQQKYLKEVGLD